MAFNSDDWSATTSSCANRLASPTSTRACVQWLSSGSPLIFSHVCLYSRERARDKKWHRAQRRKRRRLHLHRATVRLNYLSSWSHCARDTLHVRSIRCCSRSKKLNGGNTTRRALAYATLMLKLPGSESVRDIRCRALILCNANREAVFVNFT